MSQSACTFCTKVMGEGGNNAGILYMNKWVCDDCVMMLDLIITEYENAVEALYAQANQEVTYHIDLKHLPAPTELKSMLDGFVIGQERAKIDLCVAVYNHYKRLSCKDDEGVELEKSNVLLLGPTGVGKTFLAETIARILDVPFAMADATSITEAGYVGDDVESIISRLYLAADKNVAKTEMGIVYIDEIDKIGRKESSSQKDVGGEGVQQGMLKILEGTVALVPPSGSKRNMTSSPIPINTRHILFICGGAFVGLDKIIKKRNQKTVLGFGSELIKSSKEVDPIPDDFVKFGLIPEFIGRLPIIAPLHELDADCLIKILTEPKNSLVKQYTKLFSIDSVDLEIDKSALELIAQEALSQKTGARGLRNIMEKHLRKAMYLTPSNKLVKKVTLTNVNNNIDVKYSWEV